MSRRTVLAVDVGGTKTSVALVTRDGTVAHRAAAPTPALEGPAAVVEQIAGLAGEALRRAGGQGPVQVAAVGVGAAGAVDVASGTVVASTDTFRSWAGTPLRDLLAARLQVAAGRDLPVHVQNDADAHGWGETWRGAARGASTALVVAVGTGVGAAVVVDGRPVRGAHHLAGDIAHVPTPGAEGMPCTCGRTGHLEALASGTGLHRRYLDLGGTQAAGGHEVAALAGAGDGTARRAVHDAARALGLALAGAAALVDPQVVVLSGSVTRAGADWWRGVRATFADQVVDALAGVPVLPGALGDDAALVGAAGAAWELVPGEEEGDVRASRAR